MIPYALCMLTIKWPDGHSLMLRAIDPIDGGVTCRAPKSEQQYMTEQPSEVLCHFLCPNSPDIGSTESGGITDSRYREILLKDVSLKEDSSVLDDEDTTFMNGYRLTSTDEIFHGALRDLVMAYSEYITCRQAGDELDLMEHYTGLHCSEEYPDSADSWRRSMRSPVKWDRTLSPAEIAICLDCPHLWEAFLTMEWEEFLSLYWKENMLADHPICREPVTHLYIGNSFCIHLCPPASLLPKLFDRARKYHLVPVFVTSPMPESMVSFLHDMLLCIPVTEQPTEIVINDLGVPLLLREMVERGEIARSSYTLTLGILPVKRKKDFRISYRSNPEAEKAAYCNTSANTTVFREKMKDYGIERYSWEACGYDIAINGPSDILHLPLYQTNTSAHCTLYAQATYGDRGCQKALTACSHPCEQCAVLYPKDLPMIGLWNSVFGYNSYELDHAEELNRLIEKGIGRLVIRG